MKELTLAMFTAFPVGPGGLDEKDFVALPIVQPSTGTKYDPYKIVKYAEFHTWVKGGGRGVLVVGVKDRYVGTYETHCWVPSGFGGLRDGEYDCFYADGDNRMSSRKAVVPEVTSSVPFPPAGAAVPLVRTAELPSASPVVGLDVRSPVRLSPANCPT